MQEVAGGVRLPHVPVELAGKEVPEVEIVQNRAADLESATRRYRGDCVPRGQWYEVGAREWRLRVATRAARRNELRRLVEDDMVQGPVALNEDEWDDHLTARHAGHRGWRLLCVVGRDRVSMILDENFIKDHWSITHSVLCKGTQHQIVDKLVSTIMSDMQTLVINSDQDASIMDVEDALMMEMRSIEECEVMSEELQVDACATNAVSKKSVWKTQSTRSLIAHAEWVYNATFVPESETSASFVDFSGQMVGRFQRDAPCRRKTHECRKQESCFRVLIPTGEMVMPSEKAQREGQNLESRECRVRPGGWV